MVTSITSPSEAFFTAVRKASQSLTFIACFFLNFTVTVVVLVTLERVAFVLSGEDEAGVTPVQLSTSQPSVGVAVKVTLPPYSTEILLFVVIGLPELA